MILRGSGRTAGGNVWIGTFGAGVLYLPPSGSWTLLQTEGPLADLIVQAIETDDEDSVWVGFRSGGLVQVRRRPVTVLKLPEPSHQNLVLSAGATRDGSIWAATDGAGLFRYRAGDYTAYGAAEGLGNEHVTVLLEDHLGTLWAGTFGGLYRFNGTRFELVPGPPPLEKPLVVTLMEDHEGGLWTGTPGGLIRFKDGGARVYGEADGIPSVYLIALAEDRHGVIWVAIPGTGLFRLNDGKFTHFAIGQWPEEKAVRSLYPDPDGALWIAAYGAGLLRLKEGKFQRWGVADGLPDGGIHAVFGDKKGNLWFASDSGAFSCSLAELEAYTPGKSPPLLCQRVSVEDGMASRFCTGYAQPMVAQLPDGQFCFPDRQTLALFDPRDLSSAGNLRPAVVEQVLADGELLEPAEGAVIQASSRTRRLEFRFTSPNLLAGGCGSGTGWVDLRRIGSIAGASEWPITTTLRPGTTSFKSPSAARTAPGARRVGDSDWRFCRNGGSTAGCRPGRVFWASG